MYKENKAKYDEEMKTYKNSDSYKEFAAKPKESTGDRAPSFPTLALPQPGLPDSPGLDLVAALGHTCRLAALGGPGHCLRNNVSRRRAQGAL